MGPRTRPPVFLLQNAVLDGVYPVSEGRHSRLRLRQGNASVYAVWFGMPPEQLPYAMGDVVDAALNLSVYDSPWGAQLGPHSDLHPAGLGTKLAEQAAFCGWRQPRQPLTEEQKKLITPERSDIVTVYRERRWHAEDLQPLCAKLGEENTGKTLVAVTALEQVGLIAAVERVGQNIWSFCARAGQKNLADAPILKCLRECKMPEGKKAAVPAPKPVREEDPYSAKTHLHQPVPVQETATVSATAQLADAPEGALPSEVRPEIVTWEKLCEAIARQWPLLQYGR